MGEGIGPPEGIPHAAEFPFARPCSAALETACLSQFSHKIAIVPAAWQVAS